MPYEPVLLANIHKKDSHTLAVYEAGGGYRGLRRVLKEMAPKDVVEMVKSSGLRGRGGAGFPTGVKWSFLPENHPGPVYFCVNADESEPGTFVNRVQMELDPHQVLEGVIISCYATRATHGLRLSPLRIPACAASGCRRPSTSVTPPATWGTTSSAAASRWTCSFTSAPRPTSAARRRG